MRRWRLPVVTSISCSRVPGTTSGASVLSTGIWNPPLELVSWHLLPLPVGVLVNSVHLRPHGVPAVVAAAAVEGVEMAAARQVHPRLSLPEARYGRSSRMVIVRGLIVRVGNAQG